MVDLLSDTQTRPGPEMREAMARAEVGDEQRGEDPTVAALERRVAELTGKDGGVFLPSGTMCNIIAFFVHCRPGDVVVLDRASHPARAEQGGPAVHSRVVLEELAGERGVFTAGELELALEGSQVYDRRYRERVRLISVENTHNFGMGKIWPREALQSVCDVASHHEISVHMDGARLLNACAASGISAHDYARSCSSVWLDLSKGLGCPAGAVLCGPEPFVEETRRAKRLFGGAMRQAGILAAAGIYALDHHVARLPTDHARARLLAERAAELPGVEVDPADVETNIVHLRMRRPSAEVAKQMATCGVRVGILDPQTLRLVTHLDIDDDDVETALDALRSAVAA